MTVHDSAPAAKALRLDDFLKMQAVVGSGGHAKLLIQGGDVQVNGVVETRRRRQLAPGDIVQVGGQTLTVPPLS